MSEPVAEAWDSGHAYEQYVGRWSRKVAGEFVRWLALPPGLAWADVGCGTGVLASIILASCAPASVRGIDRSASFVAQARQRIPTPQASFETGDATHLPWGPQACDVSVSGLVLNFVPDSEAMAREMVRVTKPGGMVAAYVWDYAGGMEMMRHFWDARHRGEPERRQPRPGRTVPALPAAAPPGPVRAGRIEIGRGSCHRYPDRLPGFRRLLAAVPRKDRRGADLSRLA